MWNRIKTALQWLGFADTIYSFGQIELVRTILIPAAVTVLTAGSGIVSGLPIMWVLMASALAFGGVTTGLLRGSEFIQRKNPQNKLTYRGTYFPVDLQSIDIPSHILGNRLQRRAQRAQKQPIQQLSSNQYMVGVNRTIERGQIAVEIRNDASFPISFIVESAETEVDGMTPPRVKFPKPKMTLLPGNTVRVPDERIDMEGAPCQRMTGKMDFTILYGLPGKEHFKLRLWANLDIQMESFGIVTAVGSNWLN